MIRYFVLLKVLFLFLFSTPGICQFQADLTEGSMEQNPAWSGDTANWQVLDQKLVPEGKAGKKGSSYISRPSTLNLNATWSLNLNLKFKPSANNYAEVFLTAESADLSGENKAYLIRVGGASKDVVLYLKTGKRYEKLLSGAENAIVNSKSNPLSIKVNRDSAYGWNLAVDYSGQGKHYEQLGYKIDSSLSVGAYFGMAIHFTPSNASRFSFEKIRCYPLSENALEPPSDAEECRPFDLIINEILFDHNAAGAAFIELRNRSSRVIDLFQLRLSKADYTTQTIEKSTIITSETYLLYPDEYIVLTAKPASIQKEYPASAGKKFMHISKFPNFNKTQGAIILLNNQEEKIDAFSYSHTMHFNLLKSIKGVALERRDPNRPTQDSSNWLSAAQEAGFATPGYKNSQDKTFSDNATVASTDTEIFSPDNDGYNDVLSLSINANPGTTGSVTIFDAAGLAVRSLVKNELMGGVSVYTWDGLTDLKEKAGIGAYVIYVSLFENATGKTETQKLRCVLAGKIP
jgi:hypothetical protein